MYGKFFASTFTGSMFGAGANVFAVWGYTIANTVEGSVELNPGLLAAVLGMEAADVERAIERLCNPDRSSRSREQDGRRLVHEGAFQYHVVNHAHYRAMRNEEDRRAYNREAKRRERAVKRVVIDKNGMSNMSAHTEAEAETYTETEARARTPLDLAPPSRIVQSRYAGSLIGTHTKCPEGTWAACGRGLCVPGKLYGEWRAQFADYDDAYRAITAFVDRTVEALPSGPIGDSPFDFWRAAWRAEHASQAPVITKRDGKAAQTVSAFKNAGKRLRGEL